MFLAKENKRLYFLKEQYNITVSNSFVSLYTQEGKSVFFAYGEARDNLFKKLNGKDMTPDEMLLLIDSSGVLAEA